MIAAKDVKRTYRMGRIRVPALQGVSLKIQKGELVAIMGPSGSGKSTLLHQIGAIDTPNSGKILVEGKELSKMTDQQKTDFRLKKLGFVFQFYSLLPELTALENVFVPHLMLGKTLAEGKERGMELLKAVGLGDRAHHRPERLSGGEQQRVAIARALVNKPDILLADEPSANLDTAAALQVMDVFKKLRRQFGLTILLVTHEQYLGKRADRIIWLRDGKIDKAKK